MEFKPLHPFRNILAVTSLCSSPIVSATCQTESAQAITTIYTPDSTELEMPWPAMLEHDLARIGEVGWKLRYFSAAFCPQTISDAGWTLDDLTSYSADARDYVSSITGLTDTPRVIATPADSPADRAGIKPGDLVVRIDGMLPQTLAMPETEEMTLPDAITTYISDKSEGTDIQVTIRRGSKKFTTTIHPIAACSAEIVLVAKNASDAYADRHNVAITAGLVESLHNDDELAFVLSHELAHVIHRDDSSSRRDTFAEEEQADTLGAKLAFCAGYDPRRGADFLERSRKRLLFGWMASFSHHSLAYRVKALRTFTPSSCTALETTPQT